MASATAYPGNRQLMAVAQASLRRPMAACTWLPQTMPGISIQSCAATTMNCAMMRQVKMRFIFMMPICGRLAGKLTGFLRESFTICDIRFTSVFRFWWAPATAGFDATKRNERFELATEAQRHREGEKTGIEAGEFNRSEQRGQRIVTRKSTIGGNIAFHIPFDFSITWTIRELLRLVFDTAALRLRHTPCCFLSRRLGHNATLI